MESIIRGPTSRGSSLELRKEMTEILSLVSVTSSMTQLLTHRMLKQGQQNEKKTKKQQQQKKQKQIKQIKKTETEEKGLCKMVPDGDSSEDHFKRVNYMSYNF